MPPTTSTIVMILYIQTQMVSTYIGDVFPYLLPPDVLQKLIYLFKRSNYYRVNEKRTSTSTTMVVEYVDDNYCSKKPPDTTPEIEVTNDEPVPGDISAESNKPDKPSPNTKEPDPTENAPNTATPSNEIPPLNADSEPPPKEPDSIEDVPSAATEPSEKPPSISDTEPPPKEPDPTENAPSEATPSNEISPPIANSEPPPKEPDPIEDVPSAATEPSEKPPSIADTEPPPKEPDPIENSPSENPQPNEIPPPADTEPPPKETSPTKIIHEDPETLLKLKRNRLKGKKTHKLHLHKSHADETKVKKAPNTYIKKPHDVEPDPLDPDQYAEHAIKIRYSKKPSTERVTLSAEKESIPLSDQNMEKLNILRTRIKNVSKIYSDMLHVDVEPDPLDPDQDIVKIADIAFDDVYEDVLEPTMSKMIIDPNAPSQTNNQTEKDHKHLIKKDKPNKILVINNKKRKVLVINNNKKKVYKINYDQNGHHINKSNNNRKNKTRYYIKDVKNVRYKRILKRKGNKFKIGRYRRCLDNGCNGEISHELYGNSTSSNEKEHEVSKFYNSVHYKNVTYVTNMEENKENSKVKDNTSAERLRSYINHQLNENYRMLIELKSILQLETQPAPDKSDNQREVSTPDETTALILPRTTTQSTQEEIDNETQVSTHTVINAQPILNEKRQMNFVVTQSNYDVGKNNTDRMEVEKLNKSKMYVRDPIHHTTSGIKYEKISKNDSESRRQEPCPDGICLEDLNPEADDRLIESYTSLELRMKKDDINHQLNDNLCMLNELRSILQTESGLDDVETTTKILTSPESEPPQIPDIIETELQPEPNEPMNVIEIPPDETVTIVLPDIETQMEPIEEIKIPPDEVAIILPEIESQPDTNGPIYEIEVPSDDAVTTISREAETETTTYTTEIKTQRVTDNLDNKKKIRSETKTQTTPLITEVQTQSASDNLDTVNKVITSNEPTDNNGNVIHNTVVIEYYYIDDEDNTTTTNKVSENVSSNSLIPDKNTKNPSANETKKTNNPYKQTTSKTNTKKPIKNKGNKRHAPHQQINKPSAKTPSLNKTETMNIHNKQINMPRYLEPEPKDPDPNDTDEITFKQRPKFTQKKRNKPRLLKYMNHVYAVVTTKTPVHKASDDAEPNPVDPDDAEIQQQRQTSFSLPLTQKKKFYIDKRSKKIKRLTKFSKKTNKGRSRLQHDLKHKNKGRG